MRKKQYRRRRLTIMLATVILVFVGLFCMSSLSENESVEETIAAERGIYDIREGEQYFAYDDYLVIANSSIIRIIDKRGKVLSEHKFYSTSLKIATNGKYAVFYDDGGSDCAIYKKGKHSGDISVEKIVFAEIIKGGKVIIGGTRKVQIFASNGDKLSDINTKFYPLSVARAGSRLAVSGFETKKADMYGIVAYYDIETGAKLHEEKYEGKVFSDICYKSGKVIAVSDQEIMLQKKNYTTACVDFGGRSLSHFYLTKMGKIICYFQTGGGEKTTREYKLSGVLKNETKESRQITKFISNENGYYYESKDGVMVYNSLGWLRKKFKADKNIAAVSKKGIYFIIDGAVRYVKL